MYLLKNKMKINVHGDSFLLDGYTSCNLNCIKVFQNVQLKYKDFKRLCHFFICLVVLFVIDHKLMLV